MEPLVMLSMLPERSTIPYPTPLLASSDFAQHTPELYKRYWHLTTEHSSGCTSLVKIYWLRGWRGATAFAATVGELAIEENHHPEIVITPGAPARVTVRIETHCCLRSPIGDPTSAETPPRDAENDSSGTALVTAPGLTSRDLRFAWRLEALFASQYLVPLPPTPAQIESGKMPRARGLDEDFLKASARWQPQTLSGMLQGEMSLNLMLPQATMW